VAVAKVVICPSCQHQGSIPDDAKPKRIRCPKCKEVFDVAAATRSSAGPARPPAGAKRPAAAATAAFDDLGDIEALPEVASSGTRRTPGAAHQPGGISGQSPMVYAALGVGGLAVVLLSVVVVILLTRGGIEPPAKINRPEVVQNEAPSSHPAPVQTRVIEPVIAVTPAATSLKPEPAPAIASSGSSGPEVIDGPEIVHRLKEATVFIKHKVAGRALASGSGFVIEVRGDFIMVATNRHVAVFDSSEVPPSLMPKGAKIELEVVLRSGQGPQNEQALPAQILAADTTEDFSTDLAILAVRGVKKPPKPISIFARSDTMEGMAYTGAGFPLAIQLRDINESKNNPSVTITRGGIARLVNDDHGQLDLFQVDGSLQPGNSGGPIVEEKTGKLIGVAVAKVGSVDTIGFVVPAEQLRRTLAGRIGYLDLTLKTMANNNANLQIKAQIVDPKGIVRGVLVHVAPASAGTIGPRGDGTYPPLPNTKGVELVRDPKTAMASGEVEVALTGKDAAGRKVLVQTAHRDARGQLVYAKPREVELPEKPGPVMRSTELIRKLRAVQRKSFSMIGPLVDPEKDCKLTKAEDAMQIKIEVPGGKIRTLSPFLVQRINKKKPLHNAPMTLIDVEGDFAAMVEVTGEISAGATLPKDRQGNTIPFTFQGAGLLLYQNKDNFIRLERTAGVSMTTLQPIHKILFEVVKDGKQVPNQSYPAVPEGSVLLLLLRQKGRVWCGASRNLGAAPQPIKFIELDLPSKLKIGLSASNMSAKPFAAQFENFFLINNETEIQAMFGDPEPPAKK
jgi:S1-C subfamily serine protease